MTSLPLLPGLPMISQAGTSTDALGNIFDARGNHIGVEPGSVADVGSKAKPGTSAGSSSSTGVLDKTGSLASKAGALLRGDVPGVFGLSLEDAVFIVLGLMLLGSAVWSLASQTEVGKQFSKGVKEGAKTAMVTA